MYIYVYIYILVYIYIHIYINICMYICIIHPYTLYIIHVRTYTNIHPYTRLYIIHVHKDTNIHPYTRIYIYVWLHVHMHPFSCFLVRVCVRVLLYACVYFSELSHMSMRVQVRREGRALKCLGFPDVLALSHTHCNTLQHTATYCNTLQLLQHTAAHCSTLQHTTHIWIL